MLFKKKQMDPQTEENVKLRKVDEARISMLEEELAEARRQQMAAGEGVRISTPTTRPSTLTRQVHYLERQIEAIRHDIADREREATARAEKQQLRQSEMPRVQAELTTEAEALWRDLAPLLPRVLAFEAKANAEAERFGRWVGHHQVGVPDAVRLARGRTSLAEIFLGRDSPFRFWVQHLRDAGIDAALPDRRAD